MTLTASHSRLGFILSNSVMAVGYRTRDQRMWRGTSMLQSAPIDLRPAPALALARAEAPPGDAVEHPGRAHRRPQRSRHGPRIPRARRRRGGAPGHYPKRAVPLWCPREAVARVADLHAYKEFLKNPLPDGVATTTWPRSAARNRPFTGPMPRGVRRGSPGRLAYAAMTGYLRRDPGALVKNVKAQAGARITRYLTQDAIRLALTTLDARAGECDRAAAPACPRSSAPPWVRCIRKATAGATCPARATNRAGCRCRPRCWTPSASTGWRSAWRRRHTGPMRRRWCCRPGAPGASPTRRPGMH